LEIKEEPMNVRGVGGSVNLVGQAVKRKLNTGPNLTFLTSSLPKIRWVMANPAKPVTMVDPIMPKDKDFIDFVHDMEFSEIGNQGRTN
jgi:hypothetical protein